MCFVVFLNLHPNQSATLLKCMCCVLIVSTSMGYVVPEEGWGVDFGKSSFLRMQQKPMSSCNSFKERLCTMRARRSHYKGELVIFATIRNILAFVDHATPPQQPRVL